LAPALNVLSLVRPVTTFLSLVRTNAPPLPGLTCWNSTTVQSCPSRFRTTPFLMSAVDAMRECSVSLRKGPSEPFDRLRDRIGDGRQSILRDERGQLCDGGGVAIDALADHAH